MTRLLRHPLCILTLLGILVSIYTKADVWESPGVKIYYSENKEYKLVITPNITPEKYNLWNYYKSNRHPQTKKNLRQKEKFMQHISKQDTVLIPCTGELYRINNNDTLLIWNRPLLNDVCPEFAIIANDGSSVATFDNWFWKGYGVNVFVIYNEKGDAKKTYKLEEISPFPLNDYLMSISSLFWRKEAIYTENKQIEITFITAKEIQVTRIYNVNNLEFEE